MVRTSGVTDREHDVLGLLAGHLTNAEIAERLFVSVRTVESHVSSLIRKLEVTDRRGLARRAAELGLLGPRRRVDGRRRAVGSWAARRRRPRSLGLLAGHRMVTVSGPGGVGKTRLTSHTVERVAGDRPDGGWFVDLSQVSDPRAVVPAVAAAVGVVEHPGHSVEDALAAVLSQADGVLLLDNCEHLVETVERLVRRLLEACPRLTVVATSRARLGAAYEWVYELPGLRPEDAALLFSQRAEAAGGVVPQDSRVAALCARLEGMALAIELAAARYPALGLDGLAAALDDPLRLLGSGEGRDSGPCAPPSRGAWTCSTRTSERCSRPARCSPRGSRSPPPAAWPGPTTPRPTSRACSPRWPTSTCCGRSSAPRPPTASRRSCASTPPSCSATGRGVADGTRHWAQHELMSLAPVAHDDAWCEAFDRLAVEVRGALGRGARDDVGERFAEELLQRGRLEEAQHLFEELAAGDDDRSRPAAAACGRAAAARLVGDETMRLLDEARRGRRGPGSRGGRRGGTGLVGDLRRPGSRDHGQPSRGGRDRGAAGRGPAPGAGRSAAEATVLVAAAAWLPEGDPEAERRACSRPTVRPPRGSRSPRRPPSTASAPAASCAGSTPTRSRR